jgi:hypothetical protein
MEKTCENCKYLKQYKTLYWCEKTHQWVLTHFKCSNRKFESKNELINYE